MPIKLTPAELAFVDRVAGYCAAGLSQPQMAERERVSLTAFRDRLKSCSFEIGATTTRDVLRVKTGERFVDLKNRGEVSVDDLISQAA